MKKLLSFLISIASLSSFAQDRAVVLQKGEPAPFTGILMTNEMSNDLAHAVIERDNLKAQNASLNTIVKLQDENFLHQQTKVGILLEQNDKLAISLGKERSIGTWERIGWTALGVVATGIAAYGLKKVTQ